MDIIKAIEAESLREVANFNIGDTVKVYFKVIEGNKERIQGYEGIVIARKHGGLRETFTVRRISSGIGVERTFPVHSPKIEKIEVVRKASVKRAKLYYLRERTGKAAKIKSAKQFTTKEQSKRIALFHFQGELYFQVQHPNKKTVHINLWYNKAAKQKLPGRNI